MAERPETCCSGDTPERLVYRRGKLRKREDDEVRMLREALANLEDAGRVKRVLLELSRFYNPVTHGPVVGPDVRRAVLNCLAGGDMRGAREALEAQLADYLKLDHPPEQRARTPGLSGGEAS